MEELSFKTEVFEGPLDLMLALISKHKLNIMDIKISVLLEQFLLYIEAMQEDETEIASEFLEMAARLIYIKSAALLPKHELEELKKELQHSLEEYALYKEAAARLLKLYVGTDIFTREPAEIPIDNVYRGQHSPDELISALRALLGKERSTIALPSLKPIVAYKYVSVFSKIVYILKKMRRGGELRISELYNGQPRSDKVALFLALLELSAYGRVSFSEDGTVAEFTKPSADSKTMPQPI